MAVAEKNQAILDRDGWPYEFEIRDLSTLTVDRAYQRDLTGFVKKIAREFDPAMVGCLVVSQRTKGRKGNLVDGQTRWEAMRQLGIQSAPCIVYPGLDQEQEADLFARLQTQRRGMTSAVRFKAQVIARKPEYAAKLNEAIEAEGYTVGINTNDGKVIKAVAAMEAVYFGGASPRDKHSLDDAPQYPDRVRQVLRVINLAWPEDYVESVSGTMLRGLGHFIANEDVTLDEERLIERLSKTNPVDLAKRAQSVREARGMSGSSPAYMAEAIMHQYRRAGRR